MLCSKCKKNVAVIFMTKIEAGQQVNEGLCLSCAKELGLQPVEQIMNQMGIDEEQLDMINEEMNELYQELPENEDEESSPTDNAVVNPFQLFQKFFGNQNAASSAAGELPASEAPETGKKPPRQKEKKNEKNEKKKMLDTYGTNLTAKARDGRLDRVIGRDNEIQRVIQILNRRTKNNPVLLGEPGVGKTAIAEGLAVRISERRVPAKLLSYEVYLLDFTAIVAGTQFRGQFESRLKNIVDEVKQSGNIILVIDELHNIVSAGDAEGAMNAANILKPALAKGDIQIIGATTMTEYRKHIEKDTALERRFQPIIVDEPSVEDTIEILKGIKDYYEAYHHIILTDDIIRKAVLLSERYISERFLPDKAIDVIDEAGSLANLKNEALVRLAQMNEELEALQQEKESIVLEKGEDEYKRAAEIKMEELRLQAEKARLEKESAPTILTIDDVASVIEKWTKIPVSRIFELEADKLLHMEDNIAKRLIGQKKAVSAVARAIRRHRAGITKKLRPVSFIFVGPTGVGKTELVKVLSTELFDSEDALIRLDMSEYMEKHAVSKIIGSPPGYVGYDDAGQLTEKVRRKPYSVILLDEIEKAHHDVFHILLQILDDGRITDSHGKVVSFENCIIIMTSNAGSDQKAGIYGFAPDEQQKITDKSEAALKDIFRPEFLNRVDEIVYFEALSQEELLQVIDLMLRDIQDELREKGMSLLVDDTAKRCIIQSSYDPQYGARPLRRAISRQIEDKLADLIIRGSALAGETIFVTCEKGEIVLNVKKAIDK